MEGKADKLSVHNTDIAVTEDIKTCLENNSPVSLGLSGGKDSQALAFRVSEYLNDLGYKGPRVLIHSDLGRIEWESSLRVCEQISARLGLDLHVVRRKAGDLIDRWETRWRNNVQRYLQLSCVKLILPWSTASMRFCSSELKTDIIFRKLVSLFPGQSIISATGIRAEESAARSKSSVSSIQPKLSRRNTTGWDWRPILHWTKEDVVSYIASRGEKLHEAYTDYQCSRVSCAYCILSSTSDLKAAARCPGNQDVYRMLVDLEIRSTFGFQEKRWLGDIAPHLLSTDTRQALADAKERGRRRMEAEALIPKHLLFTAGWPQVIPTQKEAELLGHVRLVVCESFGAVPAYTEAEDIIARYKSLMSVRRGSTMSLFEDLEPATV